MSGVDVLEWLLLAQDGKAADPPPSGLPPAVLIGLLVLIGYFILWRPEQRRKAAFRAMLSNLKEKDRVVTVGGIHGVVTNVQRDADMVTVRVDETTGAKIRVNTSAIARVVSDDEPAAT